MTQILGAKHINLRITKGSLDGPLRPGLIWDRYGESKEVGV